MVVKLDKKLYEYLSYSLSEKPEALRFTVKKISKEDEPVIIKVDDETADEIRDWAGDALQIKGFDINYELTTEGEMLEKLIDLFWVE